MIWRLMAKGLIRPMMCPFIRALLKDNYFSEWELQAIMGDCLGKMINARMRGAGEPPIAVNVVYERGIHGKA